MTSIVATNRVKTKFTADIFPSKGVGVRLEAKDYRPSAPSPASVGDPWIYAAAAAASLVLSGWGAWAKFIPNPDSALYLRSAELIAAGRWAAAVHLYHWPMYSIAIATVMTVTGLKALVAAQIVNASLTVLTTVAFIALANRLANGDRLVMLCAAIVILLQPDLTELRPTIVRDNGYFAFLFLSLYLVACDIASPRARTKLGIAVAIVAAGLFRIEGFVLSALVPLYYVLRQPGKWRQPSTILGIMAACLLLIPGVILWLSGVLGPLLTGHIAVGRFANDWTNVSAEISARVYDLKYHFLFPFGGGNAWGAYVGLVLGIVVVNVIRALTIPLAILMLFAFFPKRAMPREANFFVLWFALALLPMLVVFAFARLMLDQRYATGMALILDISLAFLMAAAFRQRRAKSAARLFLPVAAAVLVAVWASKLPMPSKLGYLKQAGEWIGRTAPSTARVLTNDARIAYFSGRPYGRGIRSWVPGFNAAPNDAELTGFEYLAFRAKNATALPPAIEKLPGKQLVHTFPGKDGDSVFVFVRN
jgi:hypothetical protein